MLDSSLGFGVETTGWNRWLSCKTAVTHVRVHWSYCSVALSHQSGLWRQVVFVNRVFSQSPTLDNMVNFLQKTLHSSPISASLVVSWVIESDLYPTCRDHCVYGPPSQWQMLRCNVISHWLDAYTKWSLFVTSLSTPWNGTCTAPKYQNGYGWMDRIWFCIRPCHKEGLFVLLRVLVKSVSVIRTQST